MVLELRNLALDGIVLVASRLLSLLKVVPIHTESVELRSDRSRLYQTRAVFGGDGVVVVEVAHCSSERDCKGRKLWHNQRRMIHSVVDFWNPDRFSRDMCMHHTYHYIPSASLYIYASYVPLHRIRVVTGYGP